MELHQINAIRLQSPQGFVDLAGGDLPGSAVDLGHEEDFLPVAITQRLPHADFAGATIIIPAVVHEGDPAVNGAADNRYALHFVSLFADVIPAQADGRDLLSSPPQSALGDSLLGLGHQNLWTCATQNRGRRGGFQERASAHHVVEVVRRVEPGRFVKFHVHQWCSLAESMGYQTGWCPPAVASTSWVRAR